MHYEICNPKRNIKIKDIHLKTQIYLDESGQFEYYFAWNVRSNVLFFVLDRDFFPEFFDPNSKEGIWKGGI